jgi:hypothetical protein
VSAGSEEYQEGEENNKTREEAKRELGIGTGD